MAQIILAESAGFCFGVKIAVDMAKEAGEKYGGAWTDGPIIHNKQVVSFLEKLNVRQLEENHELKAGETVLIRSHGVPPKEEKRLKEAGVNIIDATCPFVKKVHEKVRQLVEEGYFVVIIGEHGHPEVIGILGHLEEAEGEGIVISNMEELIKNLPVRRKIGIVAQTTQSEDFFREAVGYIAENTEEVKIFNFFLSN